MSMTNSEKRAKYEIQNILSQNGYPTYASLLDDFDINITNDPGVVGYMEPNKGKIVLNSGLDIDQVSTIVRHEILHQYLKHEERLLRDLAKKSNLNYEELNDLSIKELKQKLYSNKNFNIAADYEISNRGYTDADKRIARAIKLNGETLKGLVTEDDHPDWVDLSVEEMYEKLLEEQEKQQDEIEDLMKDLMNNQDNSGNSGEGQGGQGSSSSGSSGDGDDENKSGNKSKSGDGNGPEEPSDEEGDGDGNGSSKQGNDSKDGNGKGNGNSNEPGEEGNQGSPGGTTSSQNNADSNSNSNNSSDSNSDSDSAQQSNQRNPKTRGKSKTKGKAQEQFPTIGSRGNEEIQRQEEEERQKQIEKEKAEGNTEEGDEVDSIEERIERIKRLLQDPDVGKLVSNEAESVVNRERLQKAQKEIEKYNNSPIKKFKESLNKFIRKEVGEEREKSWTRMNKKYAGTGVLKPGVKKHGKGKIPLINVYFDKSGSWDASKTKIGEQALGTLNNYVRQGKIKVNVYYFNNDVFTGTRAFNDDSGEWEWSDRVDDVSGEGWGGTEPGPVIKHIQTTKPDNVIIMTDSDFDWYSDSEWNGSATVPGAVWMLFRGGTSQKLPQHLKGKKQTKQFELE